MSKQPLTRYQQKRDFTQTPEPSGKQTASNKRHIFVVQKHHASSLHYDFRLAMHGTLKSWAIPKGPSFNPQDKRLAVMTEDHPLEYADFSGTIPKGQYGAGKVEIWDKGEWEPLNGIDKALKQGKIQFKLHGKKMQGTWTLIKLKSQIGKQENWLLIKNREE